MTEQQPEHAEQPGFHDEGAGPEPGHEDDERDDEQLAVPDDEVPF